MIWVERLTGILETLADHPGGIALGELCTRLDIPKGTMHRILQNLADYGFVRQDSVTGKYALGAAVLRLTQRYLNGLDVRNLCKPYLQKISNEHQVASFLTVWQDGQAICVETIQANSGGVRYFVEVGKTMPLHASAAGKLLLAHRTLDEQKKVLNMVSMQPYTGATKQSIDQLLQEFSDIRRRHYAVCEEELEPGVTAVAVPLAGPTGEINYCLAVVGPNAHVNGERKEQLIHAMHEAVQAVRSTWEGDE